MIYLILSILFSVLLLINFRLFPKLGINTFQAIVLNYPVCFLTGYILKSPEEHFVLDLNQNWTWYCILLGVGFITTFILSGISTQKVGMTVTSLANNISLVIPVLFSLFVFGSDAIHFQTINYAGLVLGIVAVAIASYKAESSNQKSTFFQGGGIALAVFIMYGITNTAINYIQLNIIKNSPGVVSVMLVMIFGAIVSGGLILLYKLITKSERFSNKSIIAAFTLGVPNFLSFYFLLKALDYFGSSGAFVYPLYNMGVILLSALVGWSIFKEKLTVINKIGLLLAIIAIIFISWNSLFV